MFAEHAIAAALNDPRRNLFGQYGPRHTRCSGLGMVLEMPRHQVRPSGRVVVSGRPTTHPTTCDCHGSGVSDERSAWSMWQLGDRIEALNRQEIARAQTRARLLEWIRRDPEILNSRQHWSELIHYAPVDGSAVVSTAAETIIFPNITVVGGYMADGRAMTLRAFGKLSTTGTPTITFGLRWGGVSGTLLAVTEAITNGSAVANVNWSLDITIQTRANGAAGSLLVMGVANVHTSATAVSANVFGVSGFDAPAAVTCDLTADTALSLTATWSASSASNTLTGLIEQLRSEN